VYLIFLATTLLTGAVALARSARDRSAYGRSSAGQEVEQ
jgi:hypothetical protein